MCSMKQCKLRWTEQLEVGRKSKEDKSPVSESALLYLGDEYFPSCIYILPRE